MPVRLARLVAAVILTAAASATVWVAQPAAAADACAGATGVTVVVDRGALGGGIDQVCDPAGGGQTATTLFTDSGFSLTYVQTQPGFVCRINGEPLSDPCVSTPPADAYWGLWWSDGTTGNWSYATLGASGLTIPDGGYVAFAWQGSTRSEPGVPATAHGSATPSTTPMPTTTPSTGGGGGGGNGGGGQGSASPTTRPTPKPTPAASTSSASSAPGAPTPTILPTAEGSATDAAASGSASPTPSVSDPGEPPTAAASTPGGSASASVATADGITETAAPAEGDELPIWVVPMVLLVLGVVGGAGVVVRHRKRLSP